MPARRQQELRDLALERSAHHVDFVDDVTSYIEAADAVVAMGGYNSVCELMAAGRPALIVPRVAPRQEQLIRAEKLSGRGPLRMLHPRDVSARRLRAEVDCLLEEQPEPAAVPLTGLPAAADALDGLLEDAAARAEVSRAGAALG
jgi:predicted glycosyltransferase